MDPAAIGIVLAGGRSSRMGDAAVGGKPALTLGAETFLAQICRTLGTELRRVLVVAAPGQPLPALPAGVAVIRDTMPGAGPLAALRDGLAWAAAVSPPPRVALVCSCDVPLLRPGLVRLLVAEAATADWVVPVVDGHPQVLVSALTISLLGRVEQHLQSGRRDLRGLLESIESAAAGRVHELGRPDLEAVDPGLVSFRDVDTPSDLERLRAEGIPPSAD
jgi:molybdopterin-guanine dinucleotide biosynthesis protein A